MPASAIAAYFNVAGIADTEVQKCFYELRRSIDQKGRPSSITQGGTITVEIVSSDTDSALADWMANSYKESDGEIKFLDEKKSTLKEIKFQKARCVSFAERFDKTPDPSYPERPSMTLTLTISAEKISFSGAEHDNKWDDKA
ncbi:type VI secretion system tube protein TssD [Spirosoma spitsbergense]|uniref:type VI secretion system tube protein TssD n=1 Tax=Spirosoma spitsbergense TaxID=431554 RepID=UPI000375482A|nr:type VI secretion system tube protein TssD [Spirosoma spitsbergense]